METNKDGEIDRDLIAAELFEAISHPTRIQILKDAGEDASGLLTAET